MDTILSLQEENARLKKECDTFKESQLRFTTIFENSRLGNKIICSDLKILQVNAAMVALVVSRMIGDDFQMTDKFRQLIGSAERSTEKLTRLVGDLLNTTRIEHGELALNKNTFAIAEMMESCCSYIQLEGKYHLAYQGAHQLKVCADHQKIEQVMVNLINNAMKYAPASLEILIAAEKLAGAVKISVIDRGIGILTDDLDKVFNRYYRADGSKNQVSGLGLALFISSEIIRRHGGEIGVDSTVGTGSSFWFNLPDQQPERETQTATQSTV